MKREKERKRPTLAELAEIDEDAAKSEQEKLERMRILERVTQRHKNKGRWAKSMLKAGLENEVYFSFY